MNLKKIYTSVLAIFSGAILPIAFAPFGFYLVAEISLILLLFIWAKATPRLAFWYGWLFGVGFFGCGVYWIYISICYYGHAPIVLSFVIVAILVAFMALYLALQGYILQRFFPRNTWHKFVLAFPASFTILEWIRGWLFSGFPWLFLGYGHVTSPLRGYATVFGVYGVTFAISATAGAIFYILYDRKNRRLCIALSMFVLSLWIIGAILTKINWVKQAGKATLVPVTLIQGNVSQERKWDPKEVLPILDTYISLTKSSLNRNAENSKIIIWPEAAITTHPEDIAQYLTLLADTARKNHATILSGIPLYDKTNGSFYNGIIVLGAGSGRYYKRQLVPFGEYLPFRFILNWLHNFFVISMSDFTSGMRQQPDLIAEDIIFAPAICYEIAYPYLILDYLPRANMLVTVSDDSWFGESIAAAQHAQIAQIRSLEVGRYQLLCTNTGITAIIDHQGKIVARAETFQQVVLSTKVKSFTGSTPWVFCGRYLWLLLMFCNLWWARSRCIETSIP